MDLPYAVVWLLLLVFPAITAWKRYWGACSLFVVACIIFFSAVQEDHQGWDSLTDLATLLVVVLPLYGIGLIVWGVSYYLRSKKGYPIICGAKKTNNKVRAGSPLHESLQSRRIAT